MEKPLSYKGTDRLFECCGVSFETMKKAPVVAPCPTCMKPMLDQMATKSELRRLRSMITMEIKRRIHP